MTIHEVVKKLVGEIRPIGETNEDNRRFENLKIMTNLIHALVLDIDEMIYDNKNHQEFSIKRAADFGCKFIRDDLGIKD
jgi:hypothetical protein